MDMGGTLFELSKSPTIPRTREDILITMEDICTMDQARIAIVDPRMAMGMEEAAAGTVPTLLHQPRGI